MYKPETLMDARNQLVVKSNELIQKTRFSLSANQQKIVLFLISKIRPEDEDFKDYEFDIAEFCEICGIKVGGGKTFEEIENAIKDIADKSVWIRLANGKKALVRWIDSPTIDDRTGLITVSLDKHMKPYLLQLKENFTQYELIWTLSFRSKYSIRLYELIKSIHYKDLETFQKRFSIDELRELLDAENYKQYTDFKKRVLVPAVKEINEKSDKIVSFDEIVRKRFVIGIIFTIGTKDTMEKLKIESDIQHELGIDANQMTLWERIEENEK